MHAACMYTVHMVGEGVLLTHKLHVVTQAHAHTHILSESLGGGGYKAVAYSKNPPLGQECTVLSSLGEGKEKREYVGGWLVVVV